MKIEYVGFELNTPTSSDTNRLALAEGVEGIKVLYAGPLTNEVRARWGSTWPWPEMEDRISAREHFGIVEIYANKAVNLYIRREGASTAIGFLRLRLERWEQLLPTVEEIVGMAGTGPEVDLGDILLDLVAAALETYQAHMGDIIAQYQNEIKAAAKLHNHYNCPVVEMALEHMQLIMPRQELEQIKTSTMKHIESIK